MGKCPNVHVNDSKRLELHDVFKEILGTDHVYFQPPESIRLKYPCIVYELEDITPRYADNAPYQLHDSYQVTLITKDPIDDLRHKIAALPFTRFSRYFPADNLNHFVYIIYY